MTKRDSYIVFLNNRYNKRDSEFYLKLIRGKTTIAADGGVRFFLKNKIKPDILIGDFDSAPKLTKQFKEGIEIIEYPVRKDKTDSQLAVELALERGAKTIDLVGALSVGEIDHTLSNILLLKLIKEKSRRKKTKVTARILNRLTKIMLLEDETAVIEGKKDDYFSVIPLSGGAKIEYEGMSYPAPKGKLVVGDSLPLRNRLLKNRTEVTARGTMLAVVSSGVKN